VKIIEKTKYNLGEKLLKREIKRRNFSQNLLSSFFTESVNVLILLPENHVIFPYGLDVARFFKIHKKNVTLLLPEHKRNLLANNFDYSFLTFGVNSVTNLYLPDDKLINSVKQNEFDLFVDLERSDSIFYSAIALNVNAQFKMALFPKNGREDIYNLLLNFNETNYENSFRNLLNSIQMF
jgi:hypothetical protein